MMQSFSTLHPIAQRVITGGEFFEFLQDLKSRFVLTEEQDDTINDIIDELFDKKISPSDLTRAIENRVNLDKEKSKNSAKLILLNTVLAFPDHFGDFKGLYREMGGDPDKDVELSKATIALHRILNEALTDYAEKLDGIDFDKESEAMKELFEKNLVEHFFAPDERYKVSLNNTIIALLGYVDDYAEQLLNAMVSNEEMIGRENITLSDGSALQPTVAHWIKDFLGASAGVVSSIEIAKYISQNKNVAKLSTILKEAVRRLLEAYSVLKNFPESFEKTSPEHWMVIPYHLAEEETKTARDLPAVPGDGQAKMVSGTAERGQAQILQSQKLSQTPAEPDTISLEPPLQATSYPPTGQTGKLQAGIDYDRVIAHILEVTAVKLSDDGASRVKTILSSRVRNIRNSIDTGERLKAALADGGAGLSAEDADKLLKEANTAAQAVMTGTVDSYVPPKQIYDSRFTIHEEGDLDPRLRGDDKRETGSRITSGMTEPPSLTPTLDPLPSLTIKEVDGVPTLVEKKNGKKKDVGVAAQEQNKELSIPVGDVPPQVKKPAPMVEIEKATGSLDSARDDKAETGSRIMSGMTAAAEMVSGTISKEIEPDTISSQTPIPPPASVEPPLQATSYNLQSSSISIPVQVRAVPTSGQVKKPVADVKAPPRLLGVVDEIRALTMKDFRRLSKDPKEAAKRILQKIQQLEKESLTKKADAIKAWKESDVYALYLEIGQINIGVDMNKLVEERKAAGKEYLTSEEFDALLDMNEKLRF